jgi:hypothetical protein
LQLAIGLTNEHDMVLLKASKRKAQLEINVGGIETKNPSVVQDPY